MTVNTCAIALAEGETEDTVRDDVAAQFYDQKDIKKLGVADLHMLLHRNTTTLSLYLVELAKVQIRLEQEKKHA